MKLGIMQPYFLPYLGYWQLMSAVDKYVIYDDVNFIKGGWINRNSLLMNGTPCLFTLALAEASSFKKINEISIVPKPATLLKTITQAYSKAPQFGAVFPLVERIVSFEKTNLAAFVEHSIRQVAHYLDFKTEFVVSSHLAKDNSLKGQDKVIAICKLLGASEYYNAIGGQALYCKDDFRLAGISLHFVKTGELSYKQGQGDFVPNLSILDALMFAPKHEVVDLLAKYTLE